MQTTQTTPDVSLEQKPEETEADSKTVEQSDEEILRIAKERFKLAAEAETQIRKDALEDLTFSAGDQWDQADLKSRKDDGRPSLVINRVPQFIRQISNDIRQNRPAVKVSPVDDKADPDTAKIFAGMIRHIEYASNADTAYDTAADSAVRCGYGYFRIVTEYSDPMSFEQEIKIKRVPDRFAVRMDPSFREPDGSDANWAFIEEEIPREDFEAQYPDSKVSNSHDFEELSEKDADWFTKSHVRVTEYFYKVQKEVEIAQLSTGDVVSSDQLPNPLPDGVTVVSKRTTYVPQVKWAKLNGLEILETTDFPSPWIPIVPVLGEELIIEGKRSFSGVVRFIKDSQRMYNYFASVEAEAIALAPKAPWVGAEGQFEGHEGQWASSNRRNIAYLEYKPKTIGGVMAPPPQRVFGEAPVQAISNGRALAGEDMKATTGIYDAGLGNKSNESSGIAIQRRANQSQTSNFHIVDNLSKSIRHGGRIQVSMIPFVYDTKRAVRTLGEDGSEEIVKINQVFGHPKTGKETCYDLGAGKYDVTVSTGPSYETKRQEAVQAQLDFLRTLPQQAPIIADLIAKNMDWNGADELAKRLQKGLPPQFQDQPQGAQAAIPPQVQQQLQALTQQNQQLTEHLNKALDPFELKRMELESRERIALANIRMQGEIAMLKAGSQEAQNLLDHDMDQLNQRQGLINFGQPIESPNQDQSSQPTAPQGAQGPGGSPNQPPQMPAAQAQQPTGGPSPGNSMGAP